MEEEKLQDQELEWVWLSLIPNLSCYKKGKLLKIWKTPRAIQKATEKELRRRK